MALEEQELPRVETVYFKADCYALLNLPSISKNGLPLFADEKKEEGVLYFSLRDLPLHQCFFSHQGSEIRRTAEDVFIIQKGENQKQVLYLEMAEEKNRLGDLEKVSIWESGLLSYGWKECCFEETVEGFELSEEGSLFGKSIIQTFEVSKIDLVRPLSEALFLPSDVPSSSTLSTHDCPPVEDMTKNFGFFVLLKGDKTIFYFQTRLEESSQMWMHTLWKRMNWNGMTPLSERVETENSFSSEEDADQTLFFWERSFFSEAWVESSFSIQNESILFESRSELFGVERKSTLKEIPFDDIIEVSLLSSDCKKLDRPNFDEKKGMSCFVIKMRSRGEATGISEECIGSKSVRRTEKLCADIRSLVAIAQNEKRMIQEEEERKRKKCEEEQKRKEEEEERLNKILPEWDHSLGQFNSKTAGRKRGTKPK